MMRTAINRPRPGAVRLGGFKRFQHPGFDIIGHPRSVIADFDQNGPAHHFRQGLFFADHDLAAVFHGFTGIDDQIDKNLLKKLRVAVDARQILVLFPMHCHGMQVQPVGQQDQWSCQ